jgi:hypothetical protein
MDPIIIIFAVLVVVAVIALVVWFGVRGKHKAAAVVNQPQPLEEVRVQDTPDQRQLPPGSMYPEAVADLAAYRGQLMLPPTGLQPGDTIIDRQKHARFDWIAARRAIPPADFPDALRNYFKITFSGGTHSAWDTNSDVLHDVASNIRRGLQFAHTQPYSANAIAARVVAENFMLRLRDALTPRLKQGIVVEIPWAGRTQPKTHSDNWTTFAITVPSMAAMYILLPNPALGDVAAEIILMLLETPNQIFKAPRDNAHSAKMAAAHTIARYYLGDSSFVDDPGYKTVLKTVSIPLRRKSGESGHHADHSYLASGVPRMQLLEKMVGPLTNYWYAFDRRMVTPQHSAMMASRILHHKSIPLHPLGMLGRDSTMTASTNPSSPFGIAVMPFARYLRYHSITHSFAVRGQSPALAYFEPDEINDKQAQYWVMYRCVHTLKSRPELTFPDAGLVTHEGDEPIALPGSKLFPDQASSFVLAHNGVGVFYQTYRIAALLRGTISELIVVDEVTQTITIRIIVDDIDEPVTVNQVTAGPIETCRSNIVKLKISQKTECITKFDLAANSVSTSSISERFENWFPVVVGNVRVDIEAGKNYALLYEDDVPKLVCPMNDAYESESIYVPSVGRFVFNPSVNQYSLVNPNSAIGGPLFTDSSRAV